MIDYLVGTTVGIWNVLDLIEEKPNRLYCVQCNVCGWKTNMRKYNMQRTKICTHVDSLGIHKNMHGEYKWNNIRLSHIFRGMKSRCYDCNNRKYPIYGGKGICICDQWLNDVSTFEQWAMGNGYEDNLTIDRIDSNQNYCPENCRWITLANNTRYKSTTRFLIVDGEEHSYTEWGILLGLDKGIVGTYVKKYGKDNTIEFIRRFRKNPIKLHSRQCYYDRYMP